MAHRPQRKQLDFGGNPNHVVLGLWLGEAAPYSAWEDVLSASV